MTSYQAANKIVALGLSEDFVVWARVVYAPVYGNLRGSAEAFLRHIDYEE